MTELSNKKCVPCEGGVPKLTADEVDKLKSQLSNEWIVKNNALLERTFVFVNFKHTMSFVQQVANIAEEENHHPVMHVYYSKVIIELWTHAIDGLSENDFILAAKIDKI